MVAGYQINTQNLVTFLYENNDAEKKKYSIWCLSKWELENQLQSRWNIYAKKTLNNKTKMTQEVETHCSMNWKN